MKLLTGSADAQEERVLESLGMRNFDVAIVAIGNDIQASILITLTSRNWELKGSGQGYK